MKESKLNDSKLVIDVNLMIKMYNKANPKSEPMTKIKLAKLIGVNPQTLSDWQHGKTPKLVYTLFKMKELIDGNITDFIKIE